jgi:hypothetical protein
MITETTLAELERLHAACKDHEFSTDSKSCAESICANYKALPALVEGCRERDRLRAAQATAAYRLRKVIDHSELTSAVLLAEIDDIASGLEGK